jgi:hypothetical protein
MEPADGEEAAADHLRVHRHVTIAGRAAQRVVHRPGPQGHHGAHRLRQRGEPAHRRHPGVDHQNLACRFTDCRQPRAVSGMTLPDGVVEGRDVVTGRGRFMVMAGTYNRPIWRRTSLAGRPYRTRTAAVSPGCRADEPPRWAACRHRGGPGPGFAAFRRTVGDMGGAGA